MLRQWDLATGQCLTIVPASAQLLWSIAISADGRILACGSDDAQVRSWDIPTQQWRMMADIIATVHSTIDELMGDGILV